MAEDQAKKPFYKKWWAIAIAVFVLIAALSYILFLSALGAIEQMLGNHSPFR
jgi:hypothetical protein